MKGVLYKTTMWATKYQSGERSWKLNMGFAKVIVFSREKALSRWKEFRSTTMYVCVCSIYIRHLYGCECVCMFAPTQHLHCRLWDVGEEGKPAVIDTSVFFVHVCAVIIGIPRCENQNARGSRQVPSGRQKLRGWFVTKGYGVECW